ncbi:ATP-dependent helicase fft2 [Diplogelasinospora grovesii]|uniref:ATP-dependent helicase fft2 n=1 Tax=Diplogelasinospora grovesii TaxID=303347 RepID=A0AAN6S6Y7_9PEZI|nr:ATP-dependent helicase fft2 [Diplogelasinospora grovesii]
MAFSSSSPVATVRLYSPGLIPESPLVSSNKKRSQDIFDLDDIDDDDEDELLSIVAKSPYFTQPTQIVTQPTQIVDRTILKPRGVTAASRSSSKLVSRSSSPASSLVEIPASSPFKQPAPRLGGRLANLMAPAGTAFRAPIRPAAAAKASTSKAPAKADYIMISDDELDAPIYAGGDSSDDETQTMRGDIRPSSFKRKSPPPVSPAKPQKAEPAIDLQKYRYDSDAATKPGYVLQRDWVSILTSSPPKSYEAKQSSPPKPPRRRLMQGRRPGRKSSPPPSLSSSQSQARNNTPPPTRKIVDLVSDDEDDDDDYRQASGSPQLITSSPSKADAQELALSGRLLKYLNECDAIQLVAIAGVKEDSAKVMISHQPFADLEEARAVTVSQKKGRKKAAKVAIGEDIVSAVKSYAKALDGIDHVIAVCESQAEAIKAATSRWRYDITGQPRDEGNTSEEGKPLTPISVEDSASKLIELPLRQPKHMQGHCVMKPFQLYGLNWMYLLYENQFGGILADDMGLGKTCQVISLMCSIVEDWNRHGKDDRNRPWPNLIMVPPSTLANWEAEFEKFAPGINVTVYRGSQPVRDEIAEEILEDPASHHVVLTSYTQVSRHEDISNLRRLQPMVAVFDEGHRLKNPSTKQYKDLIRLSAGWRLILSGTPVQNNLMEMVALLQFVDPELFRDHFEDLEALFNQKVSLTAVSQGALLHSERVARARTILEPFILQRKKEQVLKDLPDKTARVEYCEMDKAQSALYNEYNRRYGKTVAKEVKEGKEVSADPKVGRENDNNNVWIQLRKAAIHPQLFRRYFTDKDVQKMAEILMKRVPQSELRQPNLNHLVGELKALSDFELHLWCRDYPCISKFDVPDGSWMESAKVQTLLKLIRQYQANGDRALVFTRFAKVIELLGESLASEDIKYLSLQGNTDVNERQELINEFNSDESIPVFLLTTGSGGTGINLTAANKVIIFDQSDNPQDDIQAENRAHRLGQTRPVEVIRLISKDTIEELIYKACQKKLELASKVTGAWSEAVPEMTAAEMEAMVREEYMRMNSQAISPPLSD